MPQAILYILLSGIALYAVYYSFVTGEGRAPRCRRGCSPVPSPLLPGAGEMPRLEGVWDGDGRIAGRLYLFCDKLVSES